MPKFSPAAPPGAHMAVSRAHEVCKVIAKVGIYSCYETDPHLQLALWKDVGGDDLLEV